MTKDLVAVGNGPSEPLVSILMPMYNAAAHLRQAVESILAQDYPHWELIVIDDGSTDSSAELLEQFDDPRIRLVRGRRNRGLPSRLNQAIRLARGGLLARMDADDLSYPNRLSRQVAYLLANPGVDVVATDLLVIDSEGEPSGREKWRGAEHQDIVRTPWSGFHFNHATWMGRPAWFRRFWYRERALRTEDDDMMLRSYRVSNFFRMDEVLYAYRVGPISSSAVRTARLHFMGCLWRQARMGPDRQLLIGIPIQLMKAVTEWAAEKAGMLGAVTGHRSDRALSPGLVSSYRSAVARLSRASQD